jgi:hypothetical protein
MEQQIMLTPETVISLAFTIILVLLGVIGYFVRGLHSDFREVEKNLPEKYVRKDDFNAALRELKDMLQRLFDKLDTKQDK